MIDLTPLDVRNKRGDFKKAMRGYEPQEVDVFLELAAERLEQLVRENLQLRERTQTLQTQVDTQVGREQAVQDALVTAQELRADIQSQSQREADHIRREAEIEARSTIADAEAEARRMLSEAEGEVRGRLRGIERQLDHAHDSIQELERRRVRFIKEFRSLLERELDVVHVEEGRMPYEERTIDLDLGSKARGGSAIAAGGAASSAPKAQSRAPSAPSVPEPVVEGTVTADESATEEAEGDDPESEPSASEESAVAPAADFVETTWETAELPEEGAAAGPVEPDEAVIEPPDVTAPASAEDTGGRGTAPAQDGAAPVSSTHPAEATSVADAVDVSALQPTPSAGRPTTAPIRPSAPPPAVGNEPSSLELELMAGQDDGSPGKSERERFADIPDLETLLAEAGVEEINPARPKDIAPPPAPGVPEDSLILFDPNDPDRTR